MGRDGLIALVLIGLGLAGIVGTGVYAMTRGLRNNNPGNIRRSADQWQGLSPTQTDPEYFQFTEPVYGIRALARVLLNYSKRHGLNTVSGIINRWAPETENPTASYISAVAKRLNVHPDEPINISGRLVELTTAIIRQENGTQPYPPELIADGVYRARI